MSKASPTLPRRYGWARQHSDPRDYKFRPTKRQLLVPARYDMRPMLPDPYDQLQLGSCTGQGVAGIHQSAQIQQKLPKNPTQAQIRAAIKASWIPSRLAIYYDERVIEGSVSSDAGAEIRDGIKVIAKQGAGHESLWPYNIKKFKTKPPAAYYTDAAKHQAIKYEAVQQTRNYMQASIAANTPVVFGFLVYESFESNKVAKTGIMPMPKKGEDILGGHCVVAVGYDNAKQWFIVRNSWGTGWGAKGYFFMPYKFLLDGNQCADFWRLLILEADAKKRRAA